MKKFIIVIALVCLSTLGWTTDKSDKQQAADRLQAAGDVLQQVTAAPDKGIPDEVFSNAKCVAIVPGLVKAGFIFGGKHGRGVATCRTTGGWSAPAFFTMSGGSWGLQAGVEGIDLVMMIMNDKGMQHLMSNKFQIGAEAAAAAGPVGRHASAGTDWKADTEILTYSRTKGIFAGISLDGTWVNQDKDATGAVYGPDVTSQAILSAKVPPPAVAEPFLAVVRQVSVKVNAKKQE
ncbi:MAG TPA: lipid-binding SYLF domain-containing protein [Terriglobales bacterium]|nr:lipid-binding SYLF domain-containing protein [Terriglobales bacterium]